MGSFMGCTENGLKKRLAYSSISQISYVLLGVIPHDSWWACWVAFAAAVPRAGQDRRVPVRWLHHFLTGTETIDGFPGLGRRIPVTMGCFAALALSLVGIPPFGGFFSKWYLALGAWTACPPPCAISFRRYC